MNAKQSHYQAAKPAAPAKPPAAAPS